MRKYKIVQDGCILNVGEGFNGEEITDSEYEEILSIIQAAPSPPTGFCYRLKADLTWELFETQPEPYEPTDEDKAEAYDILTGVSE